MPLDLTAAGDYRVFADFTPTGHDGGLILGADLAVPGTYEPWRCRRRPPIAQVGRRLHGHLTGELVPGGRRR